MAHMKKQHKFPAVTPLTYPSVAGFAATIAELDASSLYPTIKALYTHYNPKGIKINHDAPASIICVAPYASYSGVPSYLFKYTANEKPQLVCVKPAPPVPYGNRVAALQAALQHPLARVVAIDDGVMLTLYGGPGEADAEAKGAEPAEPVAAAPWLIASANGIDVTAQYGAALERAAAAAGLDLAALPRDQSHTFCVCDHEHNPCVLPGASHLWHVVSHNLQNGADVAPTEALAALAQPEHAARDMTIASLTKNAAGYGYIVWPAGILIESTLMRRIRECFYSNQFEIGADEDRLVQAVVRSFMSRAPRLDEIMALAPHVTKAIVPHIHDALDAMAKRLAEPATCDAEKLAIKQSCPNAIFEPADMPVEKIRGIVGEAPFAPRVAYLVTWGMTARGQWPLKP
jgi:hypothetical protein